MSDEGARHEAALTRLKGKRDFKGHLAVYVIINALLVGIWAASGGSYFWPIWPMIGWGVGVAFHGWGAYFERPISETDIQREMQKGY